jgi:hypothetical protein
MRKIRSKRRTKARMRIGRWISRKEFMQHRFPRPSTNSYEVHINMDAIRFIIHT